MFSLDSLLQDAFPHRNTPAWQRSLLRTLLFEKEFKQFAADYPHLKGLDLIEQVVDYFNLSCELVDGDLENIPSQGPVVLVANHPIGSLDGLVLLRAVAAVRPDVKVVASQLLTYIEPLRNLFVPVDNVAYKTSRKQIEGMQRQLDNQGALILILREICKQRTPLRVENQQHRFQSLLLSVGPDNIVFSGEEAENAIDGACTIVIESNDAKIEFSVGQAELTEHQGVQACSTRLPQELVYIQRRRQFRITTPHWRQFFCTGEYPNGTPYELRIHDLSAGGVGLRFDGPLPDFFQPGLQFKKAELDLGSYGSFKVNMELVVVNDDQETDDNDQVVHFSRLSCRFLKLGLAMERKIQSAVFAFELDFNKKKKR